MIEMMGRAGAGKEGDLCELVDLLLLTEAAVGSWLWRAWPAQYMGQDSPDGATSLPPSSLTATSLKKAP